MSQSTALKTKSDKSEYPLQPIGIVDMTVDAGSIADVPEGVCLYNQCWSSHTDFVCALHTPEIVIQVRQCYVTWQKHIRTTLHASYYVFMHSTCNLIITGM